MNENIASKIKLFKDIDEREMGQLYKVFVSLLVTPYEDLKENLDTLAQNDIKIKKIYQVKVCTLKPEQLKERINYIKSNGEIEDYRKDAFLILDSEKVKKFSVPEVEVPKFEEEKKDDVPDITDQIVDTVDKKEPIIEAEPTSDLNSLLQMDLNEPVSKDPIIEQTTEITPIDLDKLIDDSTPNQDTNKNVEDTPKEINYDDLLNDTTLSLNENNFMRYQELSDSANHIIEAINTKSLAKSNVIYELLSKLVALGILSDKQILFTALTYKKNFNDELLNRIRIMIDEELSLKQEKGLSV